MVARSRGEAAQPPSRLPVELEEDLLEVGGLRDEVDHAVAARRSLTTASIAGSGAASRTVGAVAPSTRTPSSVGERAPASTGSAKTIVTCRSARSRSARTASTSTSRPPRMIPTGRRRAAPRRASARRGRPSARRRPSRARARGTRPGERVEAAGRLVEDEQLGPVHERLHDPDLLAVPLRELADRAVEDAVEALAELVAERRCRRAPRSRASESSCSRAVSSVVRAAASPGR